MKDAHALIEAATIDLSKIEVAYNESLSEQSVSKTLLIQIKNLMENLRSALDFAAHALFESYDTTTTPKPKIYFPYAWTGLDLAAFRAKHIIERKIPGISTNRPNLVAKLERYQWFSSPDFAWLPKFMDLNNENKHQRLTPQLRQSKKQLNLRSGHLSMSMDEGFSMHLGKGFSMNLGNMTIPGGQSISPENPAKFTGNGTQEVIEWVSFRWDGVDEDVICFLRRCVNRISAIVTDLSKA